MERIRVDFSNVSPFPRMTESRMLGKSVLGMPEPEVPDVLRHRYKVCDFPDCIPVLPYKALKKKITSEEREGLADTTGLGLECLNYSGGWIVYGKDFFCGPYKLKARAWNVAAHVAYAQKRGVPLVNRDPGNPIIGHAYGSYKIMCWYHVRYFTDPSELTIGNLFTYAFGGLLKGEATGHISQLPTETAQHLLDAMIKYQA